MAGVGWADARIRGGFGIMFDDVLAAPYAAGALLAARYFLDDEQIRRSAATVLEDKHARAG